MLYEINGKYYVLVGNKYVNVIVSANEKGDDIRLKPNNNEVIERSINVKAKERTIDDDFKKKFLEHRKPSFTSMDEETENKRSSRYNR